MVEKKEDKIKKVLALFDKEDIKYIRDNDVIEYLNKDKEKNKVLLLVRKDNYGKWYIMGFIFLS